MHAKVLIPAWAKSAFATLAVAGCATTPEPPSPVCTALVELTQQRGDVPAERSVSYYGVTEPDTIFAVECVHGGEPSLAGFCQTIVENTSHEFMNIFAHDVISCVRTNGRVLTIRTTSEHSGLRYHPRAVDRMYGRLGFASIELRRREAGGFTLTLRRRT
jgi:hypothetical protein